MTVCCSTKNKLSEPANFLKEPPNQNNDRSGDSHLNPAGPVDGGTDYERLDNFNDEPLDCTDYMVPYALPATIYIGGVRSHPQVFGMEDRLQNGEEVSANGKYKHSV